MSVLYTLIQVYCQRSFAMVHVGNDGNIPKFLHTSNKLTCKVTKIPELSTGTDKKLPTFPES